MNSSTTTQKMTIQDNQGSQCTFTSNDGAFFFQNGGSLHVCQNEGCMRLLSRMTNRRCKWHQKQCMTNEYDKDYRKKSEYCGECWSRLSKNKEVVPQKKISNPKPSGKSQINGPRFCKKQGCQNALKDHQISRCSKHIMICLRKDCKDYYDEDCKGLCKHHRVKLRMKKMRVT